MEFFIVVHGLLSGCDPQAPERVDSVVEACGLTCPVAVGICSGKNTGVGCHFLLQCMKVKSESEVAQSCLTLSDPMDCRPPGSSVHGTLQARVLEWGAIAFSLTYLYISKLLSVFSSVK